MNASALMVSVTSHDGSPVVDARVTRLDNSREQVTVTTDRKGQARFDVSPLEPAAIVVIAQGYAPDSREIGGGYPTRSDGVEQFVLGPAGWPHYNRGRVRVPFRPVVDAVGVRLSRPSGQDDTVRDVERLNGDASQLIRFDDEQVVVLRMPELRQESDEPDNVVREVSPGRAQRLDQAVRRLNERAMGLEGVEQIGALVALTDRGASFLTDSMVVSFLSDDVDPDEVASRHGLEVVKRFGALPRTYVFRSPTGAGYELLDLVDAVAAEPGVRYAEPNLVTTVEDDAVTPGDFLFPQQWSHRLIGLPDAWQVLRDLNATATFGDPAVTIAVVDNGIDAGHPSVAVTLTDGTAKIAQLFDFNRMVANNNATNTGIRSDHGMCCASAATGATDNGEGIAGVAGNCHLISARRGGDEVRYSEMYLWLAGLDPDSSTSGFPAQLTDGVDVITNSFGFSVDSPISLLMQDTFDAVTDHGRGGRGTALFFSAGNDNVDLDTTNRRPWSMYGRCYGVAASSLANDGVTEVKATYSNFGSTVDFCAPSNDSRPASHNPPQKFGAFTATHRTTPRGTAIPGQAATTTTLSAASGAGATTIDVTSVAGAVVGGSALIGPVGNTASRGRTIVAINAGTRRITLDMALPAGFANGTTVAFAPRQYRTDFGGTSYATPETAGVAALMYSVNPQLAWYQVGDILRATALKIDTGQTDAVGRWRDVAGRISSDPAYQGPFFSEWYGVGRIDAAAAVRRAAWTVDLVTDRIEFLDVPEGETTFRAVRWDVHSLYPSTFSTVTAPASPFSMPVGTTESLSGTANYAVLQEGYLWIAFTGGAPGTSASDSITVRHNETGEEWTIPITANSVSRKTACVMLVLDRSGSMSSSSGVDTHERIDVLRYSAGILVEAVHEGDGVGIVGFDHDASTVVSPPAGPLAEPTLFDPVRDSVRSAVTTFAVNINGATSIGDGIELGQSELNPVSDYDLKATVVFTDGYENRLKFISDVAPSITDRTYAVALGRAENIRPATLTGVTNGTGGFCLLTDDLNTDSRYKLAKYFLQVLAGVKNDQIVVDPPVTVPPDTTVDVPFLLAETDFVTDVMFLTQHPWLVEMTLITPDGDVVDPAFVSTLTGRNYFKLADQVEYYRLTLPVPIGAGPHAGQWLARFHLSGQAVREAISADGKLSREDARKILRDGLWGTLLVHASSDLRMQAEVRQDSFEPGAELRLRVTLSEYDVPMSHRAEVRAVVTDPTGAAATVALPEAAPGVFEEALVAALPGVWTVLFQATGKTMRGTQFTRESVRTVALWRGGDRYQPKEGEEPKVRRRKAWRVVQQDEELVELLSRRLTDAGLSLEDLEREQI
ncbi:S8 family serine peptidase [Nonomuraea sp. NPDC052129]|uniref:S8 family serine peptidase n=1 Tax=Nonomuraea sp. NPDC052129 TaxID=3154651 RepID=UPI003412C8B9